ncbi:long chain acyl-CoA synthetase 7, peroxisomal-like [Eucalyptus grandis]|uniref:long chain acyl-CoA synthetase 7, peroxisomal-like n=1 Tax=Eucalyptus grandis TaxID=71139 RepID=UPI00192EB253|nr:long chain acyl-CoA synthetase 7, peroxisomal-like [Eucalyptus grandis]
MNQIIGAYYGVAVGFYQGDNMKLMDDLAALRPTIFCSVPRLYNRIYAGITNAVKSSGMLKERLFRVAFNSKKHAILTGRNPSPMWDTLVFNRIKEKLGGRVRFMVSGASPLSSDVADFLRVCFGCQVLEGYGMTETSCVISCMDEGDTLSGHVGSPNPACEIKLVDVPEMNYTSEDQPYPRGEICVRGPIVFQGYYNDEVQTREVIDDDSWLHTGDIGLWLPGGRLKIIDRKKNIFKLAQGEYIAPEKIENVYSKCKFISQCFVYGDSLNSCLVAVVAVDLEVLKEWAASQGIEYEALRQLCNDQRAREAVLAEMDDIGREAELQGFEYVKAVALVLEPFTEENGLLTPTFKIKRSQAKAHFAKVILDMYAELSRSEPSPQKVS